MMIIEQAQNQHTISSVDRSLLSAKIAQDVADYIARGGVITILPAFHTTRELLRIPQQPLYSLVTSNSFMLR